MPECGIIELMEALHYEEHYTKKDYLRWEGEWELIEGRPYAMSPAPSVTRQRVSLKIAMQLENGIASHGCTDCEAVQDVDYEISDDTIVRPDVLLLCKPVDETVDRTPEIIFEIVFESTIRRDETVKMELYRREGVGYYGLVYPKRRTVKLYRLSESGNYVKVDDFKDEKYTFSLSRCTIPFDFSKIWRR